MDDEKSVTRLAVSHRPAPTFKFEYVRGGRKFHKNVRLQPYFDGDKQNEGTLSAAEISLEAALVVERITEKHSELLQVPAAVMGSLVEKLLSRYAQAKEAQLEPSTADDLQMRVDMTILERGNLTLSPLKVSRSKDLELKLYRDSFSSAPGSNNTSVGEAEKTSSDAVDVASVDQERLKEYGDLYRALEGDLVSAKRDMNSVFEQCRLLPSDEGYEYDRRVEFSEPDEESSWD